ncbi:zinc finger protein ZAT12-like [Papaver somniferum]|uniref:zinc finger protein ZAT12-like n=1 Tax=Papaver somniferum TaxID=3469 RepID=UPI000E6FB3A7|nr:zinc finger protein ZAT12-like [Papaver somniferum]
MMMSNKRSRGEIEDISIANMAKFLMLLSREQGDHVDYRSVVPAQRIPMSTQSRVFECKTCSRQFPSFQALGGHRASHKKPKLMDPSTLDDQQQAAKPKIHECSICGLQFAIGQALGGHMRRHRSAMLESSFTTAAGLSSSSSGVSTDDTTPKQVPVFMRSNSSRRILGLNLDLHLSDPLPTTTKDSNDFEFSTLVGATKQMFTPPVLYSFI